MNLVDIVKKLGLSDEKSLEYILRLSVAMTFIGHGAYGFVFTKAWIPFYQVLGFSSEVSHVLMPLTGIMDITLGMFALFLPLRALFLHLSVWGVFTAVLRPLAADLAPLAQYSWYEVLERAG